MWCGLLIENHTARAMVRLAWRWLWCWLDPSVGCEGGLEHWTETVKQGLDLAALGGAIWISHVQHAKNLKEMISGEDRAEEREVGGVICALVVSSKKREKQSSGVWQDGRWALVAL